MSLIGILGKNVKPFNGTAVTPEPEPTPTVDTYLIVFLAESNSGGRALNAHATAYEKTARPSVQKLDNYTFEFVDLHVGVNNLQDHTGLPENAEHSWEIGLANNVEAGIFPGIPQVYLLKGGHGGSMIHEWEETDLYYTKFVTRWNAAVSELASLGKTYKTIIWYTHGINDALYSTPEPTWRAATIDLFSRLRGLMGEDTPILFSEIMAGYEGSIYNDSVAQVCVEVANCHLIDSDGATLRDPYHWDYEGMKLIAYRKCLKTNELLSV